MRPETKLELDRKSSSALQLRSIDTAPDILGYAGNKKVLSKDNIGKLVLRLIPFFIVISLAAILLGKIAIDSSLFVYTYGVFVTMVPLITFLFVFMNYKDPANATNNDIPLDNKNDYFVSCLVAVYNEENIIEQCIKSLVDSDYENKEIIFVNDASTDSTAQILDKYQALGLINVFHLKENIGKKKALAEGMLRARGDVFVFSDSDSVLASDSITKVVRAFGTDEMIGAVSGHCRALNANTNLITKIQDSWYEGQFSIRKAFESIFGCVTCVSGPLAAFRRESIYNFIPAWKNDAFLGQEFKFATDRTLTGFVLGSSAIGEKLKREYKDSLFVRQTDYKCRDWKVVYSKSARVWTAVPDNFRRLIKQQIRWKKSFIRNIFFTGSFYWHKPMLPALIYYLHILFVLVGPFIAFRHLVYLPLSGNVLSLFLYASGVFFIGAVFGLAHKLDKQDSNLWIYRPLMSLMSTLMLSWLIFYSAATIRRMVWSRE